MFFCSFESLSIWSLRSWFFISEFTKGQKKKKKRRKEIHHKKGESAKKKKEKRRKAGKRKKIVAAENNRRKKKTKPLFLSYFLKSGEARANKDMNS